MEDGIESSLFVDVLWLFGDVASTAVFCSFVPRPRPRQHQTVSIILLGSMSVSRTEENGVEWILYSTDQQIKGAALVMRWPSITNDPRVRSSQQLIAQGGAPQF